MPPQTELEPRDRLDTLLGEYLSAVHAKADELAGMRRHLERLEADLLAVANRIEALYRSTRRHRAGKQRHDVATCENCGGDYEVEPGPPLCGRCWIELGRPTLWPLPESRRA